LEAIVDSPAASLDNRREGETVPKGRTSVVENVLGFVAQARAAASNALSNLRREIVATRKRLETLIAEERSFRLDLFGTGGPGRPRAGGKKVGRPAGRTSAARKPRRKGPPKADQFFAKLPGKFAIDDVRKLAGKSTGISLAQWARAKKIKKTASGYQKVA
jgi:hypothetical protein